MDGKGISTSFLIVIVVAIAVVGAGVYFLVLKPSGGPSGPGDENQPGGGQGPQGGFPPIFSGDVRENVQTLFTNYNGEIPKTVFKSFLQDLGAAQLAGMMMGPARHVIDVAYSYASDGSTVDYTNMDENGFVTERRTENLIPNASVPDAVLAPDGATIRLYFVDAHPTRKIIAAVDTLSSDKVTSADLWSLYNAGYVQTNNVFSTARSTDGENFTVEALAISGLPEDVLLADPSVVILENGSYRLYFLCVLASDCQGGDPASSTHHRIASAISADGTNFVYEGINYDEGVQLAGGGLSDPEVYKTGNYYRLFIHAGGGRTNNKVLTSYDGGRTFDGTSAVDLFGSHSTAGTGLRIGEIPGGYRMYFSENGATYSATSDASGETWTMRDEPKIGGRGSMAPIGIPGGSSLPWKYLLYFHA